jgi:hypothetical protein
MTDAEANETRGGETGDVLRRLTTGECCLSADGRTSMNGCDQSVFWQNDRGYQVFWNREHNRPQQLFVHGAAGFAMRVRIGFPNAVPASVDQPRATLPPTVVAGSVAHASALDRFVADLRRDGATWLALPQYEAWGDHLCA